MYRSTVGALQYVTITRPDINYAVNKVSQYMDAPLDTHWRAVKRILRYLSGTIDYGIHIQASDGKVVAFSDSDWASNYDDRRSTSGYCTFFGRNLISWCAKKQTVVARSSTEAEYRSLSQVASEVTWLNYLLTELKIKKAGSSVIWVDNLSYIALASNPVLHARTKHIELDVHFVRDKVLAKEVDLRHVPLADQIADILTKPRSHQPYVRLRNKLGVVSQSTLGLRGRVSEIAEDVCAAPYMKDKQVKNVESLVVDRVGAHKAEPNRSAPQAETSKPTPVVGEDHTPSWRDVAERAIKKQN